MKSVAFIPFGSVYVMILVCWIGVLRHGGRLELLYTAPIFVLNSLAVFNVIRERRKKAAGD